MISSEIEFLISLLSNRELETLSLLLRGHNEEGIGNHLGLSRQTIHVYVKNVYRTFRVRDRGQLMARFVPTEVVDHIQQGVVRRKQQPGKSSN